MAEPDTIDDLLEQWRIHGGWKPYKADFQRLVDEIGVLRDLLDHAVQSWSPRGTGRAPIFAEWDDTDWADSGWTEPERYELRAAVERVRPTSTETPPGSPQSASEPTGAQEEPSDVLKAWGEANVDPGSAERCSCTWQSGPCERPPAGRWELVNPPPWGRPLGPQVRWYCAVDGAEFEKVGWVRLQEERWTAQNLPRRLVDMLDDAAGKTHSEEGPVRRTLADILNAYDALRDREAT